MTTATEIRSRWSDGQILDLMTLTPSDIAEQLKGEWQEEVKITEMNFIDFYVNTAFEIVAHYELFVVDEDSDGMPVHAHITLARDGNYVVEF